MYQHPVLFQQITNRESWSPTIGLYDDDTDEPLNLTNTQGIGTFAAWSAQVSDDLNGPVLLTTISSTSLEIGQGTQSATVAIGLDITAGQFVKFLYQLDTTKWMQGEVTSYDSVSGALVFEVSSVAVVLEVRRAKDPRNNSGYIPYYDFGSVETDGPILTAAIGDGIEIIDTGVLQVNFTRDDMRTLCPGTYIVGCTLESSDGLDVRQLFVGRLPVLSGYVT